MAQDDKQLKEKQKELSERIDKLEGGQNEIKELLQALVSQKADPIEQELARIRLVEDSSTGNRRIDLQTNSTLPLPEGYIVTEWKAPDRSQKAGGQSFLLLRNAVKIREGVCIECGQDFAKERLTEILDKGAATWEQKHDQHKDAWGLLGEMDRQEVIARLTLHRAETPHLSQRKILSEDQIAVGWTDGTTIYKKDRERILEERKAKRMESANQLRADLVGGQEVNGQALIDAIAGAIQKAAESLVAKTKLPEEVKTNGDQSAQVG